MWRRWKATVGLLELRQVLAKLGGEIGDDAEVGDEEDEIAHGQAAVWSWLAARSMIRPGADPGQVDSDRLQHLGRQPIFDRQRLAPLVEPAHVGNDPVLGPGGAHGFDRGQHLAQGARDVAGGLAAGGPVAAKGGAEPVGDDDDKEQRHEDGQRDTDIDSEEDGDGDDGDHSLADDLVGPIEAVFRHVDVVTEAADRLAD